MHRHPPGLTHIAELRPDPHRHLETITRIGRYRNGMGERAANKSALHFLVPFEPAGSKNYRVGINRGYLPISFYLDSAHRAVPLNKPHRTTTGLRLDPAFETGLEQPPDQGLAAATFIALSAPVKLIG